MRTLILITGVLSSILRVMDPTDKLALVIAVICLTIYFYPIIEKVQNKIDSKTIDK